MIALDSSAAVAVALDEPDSEVLSLAIAGNRTRVGAPTLLEMRMVLARRIGDAPMAMFIERLLSDYRVEVVPFDRAMYDIAAAAFDRYGKGRGNPAGLNFGDCMAYAVAKAHDLPLLFKGDDVRRTDIRPAC